MVRGTFRQEIGCSRLMSGLSPYHFEYRRRLRSEDASRGERRRMTRSEQQDPLPAAKPMQWTDGRAPSALIWHIPEKSISRRTLVLLCHKCQGQTKTAS